MASSKAVACVALLAATIILSLASVDDGRPSLDVRSAGETTDPVAVIEPLADEVSNGTLYYLSGLDSYDLADDLVTVTPTIANYTWAVTHEDSTDIVYGARVAYGFHDLGLYKIELTVTDSWGNTGADFTAVVSVDDVDDDGMPDWWELGFLGTIDEGADSDFDSDGYSNLCEWLQGTLPNVADPPEETSFVEEHWMYIAAGAAIALVALAAAYLLTRKRRRKLEAKKIEIALELEKSLDEE